MSVEEFLELFIRELELNPGLRQYYKLLEDRSRYLWRKAYLQQRLDYVNDQIVHDGSNIWDVGCGFGTTAIYLALNGHHVWGNTLEFYYDEISNRLEYWRQFGNLENLKIEYANLFDLPVKADYYDYIIAQDTLHHLEPIGSALGIFRGALKPYGKLIAVEENGKSLFIRMKNFSKRGFKRISTYYDEHLDKNISFGNENARSLNNWLKLLKNNGFAVVPGSCEYVRLYPHVFFNDSNYYTIPGKESKIAAHYPVICEYLFFGINFTALKRQLS